MAYQPYLIANFATGIDKQLQPWLSPDDAQQQMFDGYVYLGTMSKREGYNYFATGQVGSIPYCESRIVGHINTEQARTSGGVLVTGNGTAGPYLLRIQNLPLRRGSVAITAGAQSALDDGLGAFVTTPSGGTGTVNYTTGDVSITFANAVANLVQLTVTYDWHPGLPVMMMATFVTANNTKELIVADTKRINRYNTSTRRLDYIGRAEAISGITTANPGVVTAISHGLTTGDKVFIYGVVGMNEVNNREFTITVTGVDTFTIVDTSAYTAYTSGGTVEWIFSGSQFNFFSWVNYPDKAGNPRLLFTNNADEIGYYAPQLTPKVGEYIHYPISSSPEFFMLADDGTTPITSLLALQLQVMKDRLLIERTTENTVVKPKRFRISGTGQFCDDFRTTAIGAGKIDVPDAAWLNGSSFNRDDLLFDTEDSSWTLKYTGNDTVPFAPQKIDESRGSGACFSMITYLNRTSAASPRGLIISDGYRVERQDEKIPNFSFNDIDGENFELCFAGSVDADRDHYLLYPQPGQDHSTRILTTNYEEDNYAIYRLPLSCMGTFITSYGVTWNDLFIYKNWDEFGAAYGDWQSFAYTSGAPFSVGGGHRGEVWRLNVTESEDNPQKIRNITKVGSNLLQITTDWNNYSMNEAPVLELAADTIFFTGIQGMVELNGKQFPITTVVDNYTFNIDVVNNSQYSSYTSGGTTQRVIPFVALFKKFNPFANVDRKVRCGWLYMYVDSTGTSLTRNIAITGATKAAVCVITTAVNHNLQTGEQINIFGVAGMTQLNGNFFYVTVLSPTTVALDVDSTSYGTYTSGGYVVAKEKATMDIQIITDDNQQQVRPSDFKGTCTDLVFEDGFKKWYKVYINITAKFVQFRISNQQAGAKINVQALMPGFEPSGRLI